MKAIATDHIPDFTFHNVSINTKVWRFTCALLDIFTFHNVSINTQNFCEMYEAYHAPLHSTMFLLIPVLSVAL